MIRIKGSRFIFKQLRDGSYYVINVHDPDLVPSFYYEPKKFRMINLRKAIHRQCDKYAVMKRNIKEKETKAKKKIDTSRLLKKN